MTLATQLIRRGNQFDFPRLIDTFFESWPAVQREFTPVVDVGEDESHYFVSVDLPGVKKEDLKVEIKDQTLTVSGERRSEKTEKQKNSSYTEKGYGRFERRFEIPHGTKTDKLEAQFANGVLELSIPKVEPDKPRFIEIK